MGKEIQAEFESLKKGYLYLEQVYHDEKECLMKVINTFGFIVDIVPEYRDNYRRIKQLLNNETVLHLNSIYQETGALRSSIFAAETKTVAEVSGSNPDEIRDKLFLEAYKVLNKLTIVLTDDFYPLNNELKLQADSIRFNYRNGILPNEFQKDTECLLEYIDKLKSKIAEDSRYTNKIFLNFFKQVRELEKILTTELHEDTNINSFEEFEQKINNEVGSIVNSFNIYSTINEVKNEVINRLSNIKQMLAKKKKEEEDKSQKAQKKIHWLRKKISQAEVEVRNLSKKADRFKEEANKDGLTGLYNRKAFDLKIMDALESLNQGGPPFLLVMFDVDNFKWINDTFGHVAGDRVLQKIASTLSRTFRKDEFIARYGGDEFAVIIDNLPETAAQERVSAFNENFSKMKFSSHKDGYIQISISAGISSAVIGESPEDLIHKADIAMYEIKRKRNSKQ